MLSVDGLLGGANYVWDPNYLNGRSILITGGTGSFGKALTRRICESSKPARIVIYSRDEFKQYEMASKPEYSGRGNLRFFIGDVRDLTRLELATRDIDIIVHAAAMKHVPSAEYNPTECIHTNVMGAENVVHAAIRNSVPLVVALSTDKACNPVNLYGASKLASDKIFVAANNLAGSKGPRFGVVRYGNVFGSRGSVVPLFRKLIAEGAASLPITHPDMTRFWITLEMGVEFALSVAFCMKGGEICIPKIPSMKMTELAKAMAPSLGRHIIGIRPGEKLHESMISEDDAPNTVEFPDRYVISPSFVHWETRKPIIELAGRPVPVASGFKYVSNLNEHWLSPATIKRMLEVQHDAVG